MKTAVIMSKEEAMALPLKERPICYRISSEIYHAVFEHIGEASLCWEPKPTTEVFDSNKASDVAVRLCFKIAEELEKRELDAFKAGITYSTDQIMLEQNPFNPTHDNPEFPSNRAFAHARETFKNKLISDRDSLTELPKGREA